MAHLKYPTMPREIYGADNVAVLVHSGRCAQKTIVRSNPTLATPTSSVRNEGSAITFRRCLGTLVENQAVRSPLSRDRSKHVRISLGFVLYVLAILITVVVIAAKYFGASFP